jgi:hypothetical protein
MTRSTEPPRWPMRPHATAVVVRWRQPHWTLDRDGLYRWHTKWFATTSAAIRFAHKMRDAGAIVHTDSYQLDLVHRVDVNGAEAYRPDQLGDARGDR